MTFKKKIFQGGFASRAIPWNFKTRANQKNAYDTHRGSFCCRFAAHANFRLLTPHQPLTECGKCSPSRQQRLQFLAMLCDPPKTLQSRLRARHVETHARQRVQCTSHPLVSFGPWRAKSISCNTLLLNIILWSRNYKKR